MHLVYKLRNMYMVATSKPIFTWDTIGTELCEAFDDLRQI